MQDQSTVSLLRHGLYIISANNEVRVLKIALAFDSFKGTVSAEDACSVVESRLKMLLPEADILSIPLADGGDGTIEALTAARNGYMIDAGQVTGPLPEMKGPGVYGWLPDDNTAVIEMARVSGLSLLKPSQRNPLRTTTRGTGELIRDAVERGAQAILLTLGGSATVDGGTGAARALGWRFLDSYDIDVSEGGQGLNSIRHVLAPAKPFNLPVMKVLCDVNNPLCGKNGAAAVYGPQKGATPAMVKRLDDGLANLAECLENRLGIDITRIPGSGAAGGFGGGAVAFLGGELTPGFNTVAETVRLADSLKDCDWVITGEGQIDEQSFQGKVVSGVRNYARDAGVRIAVITGRVKISTERCKQEGIDEILELDGDESRLPKPSEVKSRLLTATDNFVRQINKCRLSDYQS